MLFIMDKKLFMNDDQVLKTLACPVKLSINNLINDEARFSNCTHCN